MGDIFTSLIQSQHQNLMFLTQYIQYRLEIRILRCLPTHWTMVKFSFLIYSFYLNSQLKVHRIISENGNTGLFQYFIRVIPTIYTDEYGRKIHTNQFTITDRFRPIIVPGLDQNGASIVWLLMILLLFFLKLNLLILARGGDFAWNIFYLWALSFYDRSVENENAIASLHYEDLCYYWRCYHCVGSSWLDSF
jgi:hypothetical protein